MTAVVVDASVLVSAVTEGPDSEWAETTLAAADVLLAPQVVLVECANVLRRARSARALSSAAASAAHGDLLILDLELLPYAPFAKRIWELTAMLSAYDAWYVAVAEAARAPLASLDRRLTRAKGSRCEFLCPE